MITYVDKPEVLDGKTPAMRFNLVLKDDEGQFFVVPGFRVMRSFILPPSRKSGGSYIPSMYFNDGAAKALYDALQDSGWPELDQVGGLASDYEIACSELVVNAFKLKSMLPSASV